jgi:hypothetical protein
MTVETSPADLTARAQLARAIMERLQEPPDSRESFQQLCRALYVLGQLRVLAALEAALTIEQEGGLLTRDGMRRRTPGGTFFYVLRAGLSSRQRWAIWGYLAQQKERKSVRPGRPGAETAPAKRHGADRPLRHRGPEAKLDGMQMRTDERGRKGLEQGKK